MEEREKKGGGSGCAIGCLLMLLFAPVLYVLSIGPVALMVEGNDSLRWIGVFYYPLGFLAEYCEPFSDALSWYMELWTG